MELDIKTLPCGCITETNTSEKEPNTILRRACQEHGGNGGIVTNEPVNQDQDQEENETKKDNTFWIYIGVAVMLVLAIAYYAISTYGFSLDLFKDISIPGLSTTTVAAPL